MGDRSLNERQRLVQAAVAKERASGDLYVADLFDDRAIVEIYGDTTSAGESFEYPYTIAADDTVTLGEPTKVVRETTYKPVKFAKGSDTIVEGWAIPFGGPFAGKDFDGEDFGPDTDFALDWFPHGRPTIYQHGLDGAMKTVVQGRQISHEVRDEGVWATVQLDKSAKYHATVAKLIGAGKMYFSSGSVPHLVDVAPDGHIKAWPWVELSLTPTPANPWAAVHPVKSTELIEHLAEAGIEPSAQLIAAALKALDTTIEPEARPDPAALEAKASRVSVAVTEFRDHARSSSEMRAKTGRVLSAANRERITAALASREAVLAAYGDLEALLAETDPDTKSVDLLSREVAETLRRADDLLVRI